MKEAEVSKVKYEHELIHTNTEAAYNCGLQHDFAMAHIRFILRT
jgi:hypothetical protein